MVAKVKVLSDNENNESIEIGRSSSINVANQIPFLVENIRIQATFSHLKRYSLIKFYNDSDDVVDDIGDGVFGFIIDYIFEYPKMEGQRKYKYINVKGRRYLQSFQKQRGRWVFRNRIAVKGLRQKANRKLEIARELQ